VALCHVKVGNRQALYPKNPGLNPLGFFLPGQNKKGAEGQGSRGSSPSGVKRGQLNIN
jgi:hypothetical protein